MRGEGRRDKHDEYRRRVRDIARAVDGALNSGLRMFQAGKL